MVKSQHKILSFVLAVFMVFGMLVGVSLTSNISASAASGNVVYLELPSSWNSPHAYVWSNSSDAASQWPGEAMTKVSGEANVYSYTIPGSQSNVIFNNGNGSHQTENLTVEAGKIFKISGDGSGTAVTGSWSDYSGEGGPTGPTDPTDPPKPTEPPVAGEGAYAYLENAANWSNPTVYYWKEKSSVGAWPGKKLTDADKDNMGNYQVHIPSESVYGVIFSDGGNSQSDDLMIKVGENKVYNNSDKSWKEYDTSAVKFLSAGADVESPQYKETAITFSANAAGGEGDISYKFSVSNSSGSKTVLSDYSTSVKSVVWTPQSVGEYTITIDVKDEAGNTNSRNYKYSIKDDATSVEPVLKSITPATGKEIKVNQTATVTVNASGGKVGTNLLFYKVAVSDPSGQPVNTVYYKTGNTLDFVPSKTGTYTIDVTVQNSENTVVNRVYTYESVTSVTPEATPIIKSFTTDKSSPVIAGTAVTFTTVAAQGTAPYNYQYSVNNRVMQAYSSNNEFVWVPATEGTFTVKVTVKDGKNKIVTKTKTFVVEESGEEIIMGDVDMDGVVTISDSVMLQRYLAKSIDLSADQLLRAKVSDTSETVSISDTVLIQQYLAKLIPSLD